MKKNFWICGLTGLAALTIIASYAGEPKDREESFREANDTEKKLAEEKQPEEKETEAEEKQTKREEAEEDLLVRVLIKSDNFESRYHKDPVVTCDADYFVEEEDGTHRMAAGEEYRLGEEEWAVISPLSMEEEAANLGQEAEEGDPRLFLVGLKRNQQQPRYEGCLELRRCAEGVMVINQLPLEEYLPSVLSSEMSSSFPLEALKAQAVCARTYALKKIREKSDFDFNVNLDDSVSFQVYNNVEKTPEMTRAVEETRGQILLQNQGEKMVPAEIYYYSTSCGVTESDHFSSEEEFRRFITSVRDTDLESQEGWYRWQAEVSAEGAFLRNEGKPEGEGREGQSPARKLAVSGREENGQATELTIDFADGTGTVIEGEYDIRRALTPEEGTLRLQDGSICEGLGMLPSAWFIVEPQAEEGRFLLRGGGYGHGSGMSQNGARRMAQQGKTYYEILECYYPGMKVDEEQSIE